MEDADFSYFIKQIKHKTAIDLAQYKEAQMKRRLTTLRNKYGYMTFAAYLDALVKDGKLMNEFLDRMTINVSELGCAGAALFSRNAENERPPESMERRLLHRRGTVYDRDDSGQARRARPLRRTRHGP